jgi:hypothetical protein
MHMCTLLQAGNGQIKIWLDYRKTSSLECGSLEAVSKPDIVNKTRFVGSTGVSPARAHEKPHLQKETPVNKQHVVSETLGHRDGGAPR